MLVGSLRRVFETYRGVGVFRRVSPRPDMRVEILRYVLLSTCIDKIAYLRSHTVFLFPVAPGCALYVLECTLLLVEPLLGMATPRCSHSQ